MQEVDKVGPNAWSLGVEGAWKDDATHMTKWKKTVIMVSGF